MKVGVIALNTIASLVRNRLVMLFVAIFLCLLLLFLLALRAQQGAQGQVEIPGLVLTFVQQLMSLVSGFGDLLAVWLAAAAVAEELRSGTAVPVLARPLHRWQFLLGKYLGVLAMMAIYVLFLLGFSYFLTWLGGLPVQTAAWTLLVYPLTRYAIYAALALLLATRMPLLAAFSIVLVIEILASIVQPGSGATFLPAPVKEVAYVLLPSAQLLSESRFLSITQISLLKPAWDTHATALAYGLDYALVCFLLAAWSFQRRSLAREH
jgi:ABC-type transport system involved in multi-copper enzyme maturation permease subunit